MKQSINALRGLRYKLRMMGIPISGISYIYGDNMSVVSNTSRPESVLRKKSNSVYYHSVHESVAMGESLVRHIPGAETNLVMALQTTNIIQISETTHQELQQLTNIFKNVVHSQCPPHSKSNGKILT